MIKNISYEILQNKTTIKTMNTRLKPATFWLQVTLCHRPWSLMTVSEVLTVMRYKTVVLMDCVVAGYVVVLTDRCAAWQELPSQISK